MIAQRPLFGSGPGTFKLLFLPALAEHLRGHDPLSYWGITEKMNEPHNEFLQLAVETGVPGLIIFLMFCGVIVAAPLARAEGLPLADRLLAAAGASSLVAGLADAAASIPFHVVPTRVAFWAVAALMFPLAHRPRGIGGQQSESGRCAWRWLAAPYLVLFAGITMYYSQKELTFEYYLKAATGLALARRHDQSLPFFEMALRTMPRSGQLKFYYGSALVQMGRYAEGAAMLEDAKTNFQDVYLFKNLGIAYERMGQQERAVGEFQKWRAMGITSHEANNLIGFVRLRQGMKEEAVAAFKETLRVRPWDWIAYSSLANILIDAGRSDEAVRTLRPEPFATGKDRRPEAFTIYGVALLKAGRYAESQKYFVRTIALEPGSVTAHNNLAALYWRTGMRDDAIREWREALRLDPKNEVARKNIEAVSISEVSAPEDTTGKSPRPNVECSSREY
jgi:tetratricopeptide (TPR) repeat protein